MFIRGANAYVIHARVFDSCMVPDLSGTSQTQLTPSLLDEIKRAPLAFLRSDGLSFIEHLRRVSAPPNGKHALLPGGGLALADWSLAQDLPQRARLLSAVCCV